MKRILWPLLACPLIAAPPPRSPVPPVRAARGLPGGYRAVDIGSADVQEAKAAIRRQLACLPIETVLEAYVQVVAGSNFKLVCQIEAGGVWEFVVWHRLNDLWELTSARRLSVE